MMNKRLILIILFFFSILNLLSQDRNISTISLEKVNIVYRGIRNPIKIAFPGAKSFNVEAYGNLKKVDSIGNYDWNVTNVTGTKAFIKIDAIMQDNSIIHEEKEFEIRSINPVKTTLDGKTYNKHTFELTKSEILNAIIDLNIDDFSLNLFKPLSKSFEIYFPNKEFLIVQGNRLDIKAASKLRKVKKGQRIIIRASTEYEDRIEPLEILIID